MEFGRVENVDAVDFVLPKDDKITTQLFKEIKSPKKPPEVYIGCAKWGRPDWIGKIYPKGTKQADFLKHYVTHFNCIELNALFYQLFPQATIEKWAGHAGNDFRFCPKFSNYITHIKRLKSVERETDGYLRTVSHFGNKLGTAFIQLDDRFSPKQFESVYAYLKSLPRDFDVALELRHPDWFTSGGTNEIFSLMKELGTTTVITDTSGRRDVLHMKLTTPKAFIRFVGNGLHPTDYKRIDAWIERINMWLNSGLQTLYFFIHQHDELHSPDLSKYMIDKLNTKCNLKLKPPHLINNPQTILF